MDECMCRLNNFHFGIDLTDPTPSAVDDAAEAVYSVRTGYVRDVFYPEGVTPDAPMAHDNYGIVICDEYQQQTGFGWCLQHIEDYLYTGGCLENDPWSPDSMYTNNFFVETARLGDIDNDAFSQGGATWTDDHLHFMRSAYTYNPAHPGYLNPLFYLDPAPVEGSSPFFDWSWDSGTGIPYGFFVIPQYSALNDWETE